MKDPKDEYVLTMMLTMMMMMMMMMMILMAIMIIVVMMMIMMAIMIIMMMIMMMMRPTYWFQVKISTLWSLLSCCLICKHLSWRLHGTGFLSWTRESNRPKKARLYKRLQTFRLQTLSTKDLHVLHDTYVLSMNLRL